MRGGGETFCQKVKVEGHAPIYRGAGHTGETAGCDEGVSQGGDILASGVASRRQLVLEMSVRSIALIPPVHILSFSGLDTRFAHLRWDCAGTARPS